MNDLHVSVLASLDWQALSTHWILTLAHFLWQGAAIGLLTAAVLAVFRHAAAHVRHGICLFALLSFLPCLIVTWMSIDVDKSARALPETAAPSVVERERPAPRLRESRSPVSLQPVSVSTKISHAPIPREDTSAATSPVSNPPVMVQSVFFRIAPLLAVGYFAGVLLLLARTSIGLWGGRRLRTLSQQIHDAELISLIGQQARRIGLKRAPVVAYCSRVAVPTVIGLLKPVVLLPASLVTHLETDQLAAVLSHEFAHLRRHDLFVNLLQRLIEAVLFFHPAVWWISRRISFERENCCDDLASASGFGNLQYAGALLRMAELSLPQRGRKFASQLVALSADGQSSPQFSRRIERLLNIPRTPRLAVSRLSAICAVILSVVSVGVLAQIADKQPVDEKPITAENKVTANDDEVAVIDVEETPDKGTSPGSQASEKTTTTANEDDQPQRPAVPHLEFLKPYPKLYELSLAMTEVQFLAIVQREELKIQKVQDGRSYWIPTDDGLIVIVMFGNNGDKCSGIQRIVGGALEDAKVPEYIVDKNGIYWSGRVLEGFRVGAKLLVEEGQITSGDRLVVQYVLKNESDQEQSVEIDSRDSRSPVLEAGNRIVMTDMAAGPPPRTWILQPGEILEDRSHRAGVDTTGFVHGHYRVQARNFHWQADPENRAKPFPTRRSDVEMPVTIVAPDGGARAPGGIGHPPDDIDWGRQVAGLQVGSRLLDDSKSFGPEASPQWQLFVRNTTTAAVDVEVFVPHPAELWWLRVEDSQGERVPLQRFPIDVASPEQSFNLKLAAGQMLPLTGVKRSVNNFPPVEIGNPLLRIAREKANSDSGQRALLVSKGGDYRAVHTVVMKRSDMPGVRLNVSSGKSSFRVSGPELKNTDSEKDDKTNPGKNGAAAIRLWKARLVDGMTGKPLPGITVRVQGAISSKSEPQPIELVSSGQGIITVPLRDGMVTVPDVLTENWWLGGWPSIGRRARIPNQPIPIDQQPDPETPREVKLWRGAVVKGKLLYPDKSPASGVQLNVGVYITHVDWKKRLGMDLTFHSWDHGEWPNWSRSLITNDDGTFTTTVPPADARSWVRVGTTTLGFASINPERIDAEGPGRALAICVPFEANIGYSDAGFGYRTLGPKPQVNPDDGTLNFGTLQLKTGNYVRGRVVDADGNGLANVCLMTEGPHGPYAGRSAWSGEDGRFQFLPVEAGSLTIHPDARLRGVDRNVISRDVQAVFIHQKYAVPPEAGELVVQAVPHVELEFEWIDRRANKDAPVSYYGTYQVNGRYALDGAEPVYWNGETTLIERDGRKFQVVKVPRKLMNPTLDLPRDRVVTASYGDETGKTSGPGHVELGDITKPIRRTIYADEPSQPE